MDKHFELLGAEVESDASLSACPVCGQLVRKADHTRAYRAYHGPGGGPAGEVAWREVEYREPVREATRESDVVVPMLQAIVSGILGGVLLGAIALIYLITFEAGPWYLAPGVGLVSGIVIAAATWSRLLGETRELLYKIERRSGRDLDGDGQVGAPETLRVEMMEMRDGANPGITIADLPVSREALASHARSVEGGVRKWSRRDLSSHPLIGAERARQLLQAMETHGFLHYPDGRNHPDGGELTAKGRALARGLVGDR